MIRKLLIIRFSAMGDVAMLVPVVSGFASAHPDIEVTVLTRRHLSPLFSWCPPNVRVEGVDLNDYKGVRGLNRLYARLREGGFDAVADMHDVLRTKHLRLRFRLSGIKTAFIDKGRSSKKRLIGNGASSSPLTHTTVRYMHVLEALGFPPFDISKPVIDSSGCDYSQLEALTGKKEAGERWIGVAPFAAHPNKVYPLGLMHQVVNGLAGKGARIFLFGAGKREKEVLDEWEDKDGRITSVCGKLGGLRNEMLLMSRLDLMLAMDSSNMHMAAVMGTPVVSVWGATHPNAGFTPWNQPLENIIQVDDLECRPCSIYGKKPCKYGDLRCMNLIKPEAIIEKVTAPARSTESPRPEYQ